MFCVSLDGESGGRKANRKTCVNAFVFRMNFN